MRWDLLPLLASNTTYQKSLLLVVSSERAIESECNRVLLCQRRELVSLGSGFSFFSNSGISTKLFRNTVYLKDCYVADIIVQGASFLYEFIRSF